MEKKHKIDSITQLSFSAIHPRGITKMTMPPSEFMIEGFIDAREHVSQDFPDCFFGVDWVSFRLTAPNKVDSIRITGDYLPEYLTDFFESRVLASQPYWRYVDHTNRGPITIRMPVFILNETEKCVDGAPKELLALRAAVIRLYKKASLRIPNLEAVQESKNVVMLGQLCLCPIY
ncbi:hypothetical protein [Fibrella aestuarina]|uniref:hypothetical protein n=1 Tax=Fibrella aestuarina TaxID=651143 RepID=UPI0011D2384F|nr:hypothetical protein [Fibrella aestuarina]